MLLTACPSCLPPLNIHQSRTVQSCVETHIFNQACDILWRHFCFKSVLYLLTYYLLIYLLWTWSGAGPKIEWAERERSGSWAWKNTMEREREVAWEGVERWAGVTEGGVSGERKFQPFPLRSYALIINIKSTFSVLVLLCFWFCLFIYFNYFLNLFLATICMVK